MPKYPAVSCIYGISVVNYCKKCLISFFAISLQHVTVMNIYSSTDAAIILYIYICLSLVFKHC